MVEEIHIIHHSHTDLGYTDLPSHTFELHSDYLNLAIDLAWNSRNAPPASRFRWVHEVLVTLEHWLKRASASKIRKLLDLVRRGQIEIAAMPFNAMGHMSAPQWASLLHRYAPLYQKFRPRIAMQNDVNGFSWGLLPSLHDLGVRSLWMGINTFSGATPLPTPNAFFWLGPTNKKFFVFLNRPYGSGFKFFHAEEWRKGAAQPSHDLFAHPPGPTHVFLSSPEALASAHTQLHKHLAEKFPDYPYALLPTQITNNWRYDNDPPLPHLPDFVNAWNAANLSPRLRLSTPSQFNRAFLKRYAAGLPTLRGDWPDWWNDGLMSMPLETRLNQNAKSLLADAPLIAQSLRAKTPTEKIDSAFLLASLFDEHTFGAYESVADSTSPRAIGNFAAKQLLAAEAHESALNIRAQIVRSSPAYCPSASTCIVSVLNPSDHIRQGYAEISARTLRYPANALRDLQSHEVLPLEPVIGPEWAAPRPDIPTPFETPSNLWPFVPRTLRAFVGPLQPRELRRYEIIHADNLPQPPLASTTGSNAAFSWTFNTASASPEQLHDLPWNLNLLDPIAPFRPGQIIIDRFTGDFPRDLLATHSPSTISPHLNRDHPVPFSCNPVPSHYSARFLSVLEHPIADRIEQTWDFFASRRIEITTTLWLRTTFEPLILWLALPLSLGKSAPAIHYESIGHRTRVGVDQLPNSCAEHIAVGHALEISAHRRTLAVATPDNPLMAFDAPHSRDGTRTFIPQSAHLFSLLHHTAWTTNFSHTRGGKITARHILQPASSLHNLTGSLLSFPST